LLVLGVLAAVAGVALEIGARPRQVVAPARPMTPEERRAHSLADLAAHQSGRESVGLGQFFTRDLKITQTDTVSGVSVTDVIVQPPYGMGWPAWHAAGPYQGCLQISAAWRASLLLAELLGRLPWDEYRSISPEP